MFWVLGFTPAFITARILKKAGVLRIPREIELVGLDIMSEIRAEEDAKDVVTAEQHEANNLGIV